MSTPQRDRAVTGERVWSEEEKSEWLAAHAGTPTHVVTFEPLYQVEVCIPPWEQPYPRIARDVVTWGTHMRKVFDEQASSSANVVSAHHEGNSLEVNAALPAPRLRRVL
jgi:hypothetical protein